MTDVLSDDEIADRLPDTWVRDGDEVVRVYEFSNYLRGVNFAQMVGEIAQVQSHYPEIIIRHKEIEIRLTTPEAGGITRADISMAEVLEAEQVA